MPEAGQRIGEYVLESRIGDGASGEVWRGRHHVWADQLVAVKIPRDLAYLHNLRREGVFVHGLKHPCIVRAMAFDPFADPPYLVMEYVPGTNLRPLIGGQRLPVADVVAILGQVLAALEHAHGRGMVHRDIKPENILIHEHCQSQGYGSAGLVKVADFGLGQLVQAASESIMYSQSIAQGQSDVLQSWRHVANHVPVVRRFRVH